MSLIAGPDCELWVERLGDGEPVSVFAHGVTGSTFDLEPLAAATPGSRVLFDLRGHGRSASPPVEAGYGHAAVARDLDAVAAWSGARRAFGLSAGAGAILRLLAADPGRFDRAVLMLPASIDGPNHGARAAFPALAGLLERHLPADVARIALRDPEYQPLFAERPMWRTIVPERIVRMNGTGVPRAIRAHVDGAPPLEDASALTAVEIPVLLIAHHGDPLHPIDVAERLAGLMPGAELRAWSAPLAMYDDTPALARLIADFLAA